MSYNMKIFMKKALTKILVIVWLFLTIVSFDAQSSQLANERSNLSQYKQVLLFKLMQKITCSME